MIALGVPRSVRRLGWPVLWAVSLLLSSGVSADPPVLVTLDPEDRAALTDELDRLNIDPEHVWRLRAPASGDLPEHDGGLLHVDLEPKPIDGPISEFHSLRCEEWRPGEWSCDVPGRVLWTLQRSKAARAICPEPVTMLEPVELRSGLLAEVADAVAGLEREEPLCHVERVESRGHDAYEVVVATGPGSRSVVRVERRCERGSCRLVATHEYLVIA